MSRVRTSLLIALLIVASLTAFLAMSHLHTARDRAEASAQDLATCRQSLADLRNAGTVTPSASSTNSLDNNQSLRDAAVASNAAGKLGSIQPGQPARIEGTDYLETPVFLRLDPMPLKQLVTFLHESSTRDPRARCRSIELSAAEGSDAWSADITMGYLGYSPVSDARTGK